MSDATKAQTNSWYLAQLKPKAAKVATRNLARQGYEVFNPIHRTTLRRADRFVQREEPLFPGYLFVGLDPQRLRWGPIRSTMGVCRVVGFGAGATEVPLSLIVQLQQRCNEDGLLDSSATLVQGDVVCVRTGPFADFVTRVEQITPDRRVWVLLDLMGRATRVLVDQADLVRV
jgi:transcriptional antiterminator RfaH